MIRRQSTRCMDSLSEVYMASIGQPIVEYLVNFEFFIDMTIVMVLK